MRRVLSGLCVVLGACSPVAPRNVADTLPQLITNGVPFRYPLAQYEQKVQGDVTLRLHVDSSGAVVPESVAVVVSSRIPELDAAARQGAPALRFRPAVLNGRHVPLTVLFPVMFRVPNEGRTPNDTSTASSR